MNGGTFKVAVLYNAPVLPCEHPDAASEHDVVDVAESVASHLRDRGFCAWTGAVGGSPVFLLQALGEGASSSNRPDVAFNLIEGFGGLSAGATYATGLLELSQVAYTGSPVESLAICQSKARTKALLRGWGIPTASFSLVGVGEKVTPPPWTGPTLVKPDAEDGSLGVDQESVASDFASLRRKVEKIHETYGGAALLEAYLPGAEYNVGIVALPEPVALPIAEVRFAKHADLWPILTYDAKWNPGSREDRGSPVVCPAALEPELARQIEHIALSAYRLTGCRDYARVDLRLDQNGEPMVLEVNPNPDIGIGAGWARALRASGRDYGETLAAIVHQALERHRHHLRG